MTNKMREHFLMIRDREELENIIRENVHLKSTFNSGKKKDKMNFQIFALEHEQNKEIEEIIYYWKIKRQKFKD